MPESISRLLTDPLFLVFVLIILLAAIFNIWNQISSKRTWAQLADRFDLKPTPGHKRTAGFMFRVANEQELAGTYHNRPLTLSQSRITRRKNKIDRERKQEILTAVALKLNCPPEFKLRIQPKLVIGKRPTESLVSDDDLNRCFLIKSEPDDLASHALSSQEIRRQLVALKHFNRIFIFNDSVVYEQHGRITRGERLEQIMQVLECITDGLERAR